MSKIRENIPAAAGEISSASTGDFKPYEVFVRLERGKPQIHAGTLEAPDDELALQYGREHYGRDQPCVEVWVVPRAAIMAADQDREVIWRLSDQSYRQAKGYNTVRRKWEEVRKREAVEEYVKEDLKEGF